MAALAGWVLVDKLNVSQWWAPVITKANCVVGHVSKTVDSRMRAIFRTSYSFGLQVQDIGLLK